MNKPEIIVSRRLAKFIRRHTTIVEYGTKESGPLGTDEWYSGPFWVEDINLPERIMRERLIDINADVYFGDFWWWTSLPVGIPFNHLPEHLFLLEE